MRAFLRSRRLTLSIVVALVSMVFTGGALALPTTPPAQAAASAAREAAAAPVVANKITLGETSVDGPAFWTNVPTGEPGAGANSFIAWTGTDPAHHLNIMRFTQSDGNFNFTNKETLKETSIAGPAVTAQPSQIHNPYYFVAWTGTNPNHSLNVICDGCAPSRVKLTLPNESSFAPPALAMLNGKLMLAWTGTDANHSLNILDISITDGVGFVVGKKTTLEMFSSSAGPGLVYQPDSAIGRGLLLSWMVQGTRDIHMALSPNGTSWPVAGQFTLDEQSDMTPRMLAFVPDVGQGDIAHNYLAWTGIDPAHSLNLLYPAYPPQLKPTKVTFPETALGYPALGLVGSARIAIMWTGTDTLHHLNFATIDV